MRIRTTLTLWFTAIVGILMLISNIIVWYGIKVYLYNQKIDEVKDRSVEVEKVINALAKEKRDEGAFFNIEDTEILSYTLSEQGTSLYEGAYMQLTTLDNRVFSKSPTLEESELPILKKETLGTLTIDLPSNKEKTSVKILYYTTTLEVQSRTVATLQLGLPLTKNERILNQIFFFLVLKVLFSIAISVFLGMFLSKRSLSPMVSITNEVNKMEGQSLLKLLDTSSLANDEIGQLAKTFNSLLSRISEAFDSQKRFVSDASHELRSPLTTIKGYAQLLMKRGNEKPELQKEALEVIIRESERLERLVNDMLILARSEGKDVKFKEIDIIEIVNQLLKDLMLINHQIRSEVNCNSYKIFGNEDSLRRVFINILDNALRVISKNGYVLVKGYVQEKNIVFEFIDNGIGIDPEHLPYLFDRFYRADYSRDRDTGGSGLGLSLVKEIINEHHGKIFVESQKDIGTKFTVKLPEIMTS